MKHRHVLMISAAAIIVPARGGDGAPSRSDAVAVMTDADVPIRWQSFADDATDLRDAIRSLCDESSGGTDDVAAAVATARASWSGLSPWWFGPVMDRRSRFVIDFDVSPDEIDELLASDQLLDANSLRDLFGADQRGLGAIDHVLARGAPPGERECEFIDANAALVAREATALAEAWVTFGPDSATDDASANETIEAMVNESLFTLAALPDEIDAEVVDATLRGIRWAIIGDTVAGSSSDDAQVGLGGLLDDDVVGQLAAEFDAAIDDPTDDRLMDLEITITTNIVSTLGLSIQFSDADGDG